MEKRVLFIYVNYLLSLYSNTSEVGAQPQKVVKIKCALGNGTMP